jgi:hypothetical protein
MIKAALAAQMAGYRTPMRGAPPSGPVWENNHAAPPAAPERPADWAVSSGLAGQLSPTMGAYGMGQAAGQAGQAIAAGDYGGAAEAAAPAAMAMLPGLRGGWLGQILREKLGLAKAAVPEAAPRNFNVEEWRAQEKLAGRTPHDSRPGLSPEVDHILMQIARQPIRRGPPREAPPSSEATQAYPRMALDGIDGPAPAVGSQRASYPPIGSEMNDAIRGDYMDRIRTAGTPPHPGDFNKAVQAGFQGAEPAVPRLNTRVNKTNENLTQFQRDMGRLPATYQEFNDYVFAKGKPGSIPKGTLAVAGAAGSAAAQGSEFDREQYMRWIAEQLAQRP